MPTENKEVERLNNNIQRIREHVAGVRQVTPRLEAEEKILSEDRKNEKDLVRQLGFLTRWETINQAKNLVIYFERFLALEEERLQALLKAEMSQPVPAERTNVKITAS